MASNCHIQRNLSALKDLPRVASFNIKDLPGAKKAKRRKGRGPGSKRGKTSGRGHKGQGQRGSRPYFQFEGGQTPFYRLFPKHGLRKTQVKGMKYSRLNLDRLQYFIDSGRINPNEPITMRVLRTSGAISGKIVDGVKLLGIGADWFQAKVDIEVSAASESAINAVERQGGNIKCVYFDKIGIRVHLQPERFAPPIPRPARPPNRLLKLFADPAKRGFLASEEEILKLKTENQEKADKIVEKLEELKIK